MNDEASFFEVLSAAGPGAIALVRLVGPAADRFLNRHVRPRGGTLRAGCVVRAALLDDEGQPIDDMLVTVHSQQPQWDLWLNLHGSPYLVRRCCELASAAGLRQRTPRGEFWAARDRLEALALSLLPEMSTQLGVQWLLGQVVRLRTEIGRLPRSGALAPGQRRLCEQIAARRAVASWLTHAARLAVLGPPNAGKSTLVNALAGRQASIVSPVPGTTRDWVETPAQVGGLPVTWLDTAGLRRSADPIEQQAMRRARRLAAQADAVLLVLDAEPTLAQRMLAVVRDCLADAELAARPVLVVWNKVDLLPPGARPPRLEVETLCVSARQGAGLERLAEAALRLAGRRREELDEPAAFCDELAGCFERAAATGRTGELAALLGPPVA